jgi:hypothetical protein
VSSPRLRIFFTLLTAACALVVAAPAAADWHQPVGGASPINNASGRSATNVGLASVAGWPYVAWNEDTSQPNQGSSSTLHVAKLAPSGLSWLKLGESSAHPISFRATSSSDNPSLADVGGTPWVAWQEGVTQSNTEIRVSRLAGDESQWNEVPTAGAAHPINHLRTDPGGNAMYPTLRNSGGRPYVSFFEADPGSGSLFFGASSNPAQVWVMRLNANGDGWDEVGGGPVNPDSTLDAAFPRMTVVNGVPWLVFFQIAMGQSGPQLNVDVAHLSDDGASWVQMPAVASGSPNQFGNPTIENVGGTPYVALPDKGSGNVQRVTVYKLNAAGDGWDLVGGGAASDAAESAEKPVLADVNGAPWVSWLGQGNSGALVHTAQLVDGVWRQAGTSANANASHRVGFGPSLASINGIPWVAFSEDDGTTPSGQNTQGCCNQVRVSRLEPTFLSNTAYPSDTSATVVTKLQTFGLAYPVGFNWGSGSALGNATPASPTSNNPAFAFQAISGLTVGTLYSYAPYATAGTPLPRVTGSSDVFVTQSTPTQGPAGATGAQGPAGAGGKDGAPGPAGPQGTAGPAGPAATAPRLFAAIVSAPTRLRRGHALRVRYLVTDDAAVRLVITRAGRHVATVWRKAGPGRHIVTWTDTRHRGPGLYRIVLEARAGKHTAIDRELVRIL